MKTKDAKEPNTPESSKSTLAMKWLGSLMFIQFLTKMLHFVLNFIIVGYMSPESYGVAALQLPFVGMAITRLIKEALHRTAVRESDQAGKTEQLALVWMSIPLGIILSSTLGFFFLSTSSTVVEYPWMVKGFVCWIVSSWLELAIEPVVIYIESNLLMNVIVMVEVFALGSQSVVTIALLYLFSNSPEVILLVHAIGQLVLAGSLALGYFGYAIWWSPNVFKSIWPTSFKVRYSTLSDMKGFLLNSVGKYVTAEGEHAILFFFGTPEQQGVYEFVAALGSMVARIAFQSIEKTGFVMFTRLASNKLEREKVWKMLMNVSIMISLLYLAVCPTYIFFLVKLVYGPKWGSTDAPFLLILFGVYLLLIGINGLVESLRDAVSPYEKLQKQTPFLIFSILSYFAVGSLLIYFYGAAGLIIASCISTFLRTIFNAKFFKDSLFSIRIGIPETNILVVYAIIFITGSAARFVLGDTWKLFGFGVLQGGMFVVWMALFQMQKLRQTWSLIKKKEV